MSETAIPSDQLNSLRHELLSAVAVAEDVAALEEVRVAALGKKGRITELMKTLGTMPPADRKTFGAALNVVKDEVALKIEAKQKELAGTALQARLASERTDVTLAPRPLPEGRVHPISQTIDEIVTIFGSMGFKVAKGPDIESDYFNFAALNFPKDHPARDMQATFFLPQAGEHPTVLRTHTSPVQIHTMMNQKPPIRVIIPGRTYRYDHDMTHTPMFHQVEGLMIDKTTHMGHLKGCLMDFLRAYFGVSDLPV
ncbi:MAG: phenylalanine--tRNA ligase subunit alpha, partial [Pseudomonadota bacterium]|nr:phenylalanine--tRNA ligase subunit alpha [Pseudomonadota bacterium]